MCYWKRIACVAGTVGCLAGLTTAATADPITDADLMITEIMYDPYGSDNQTRSEWVEIYNHSNSDIDLSGYRFQPRNNAVQVTLNSGTTIKAKSRMVLAANKTLFLGQYHWFDESLVYDLDLPVGSALTNVTGFNANAVSLYAPGQSAPFETVPYGSPSTGWPAASGSNNLFSIELKSPSLDNKLAASWKLSEPLNSPGKPNAAENMTGIQFGAVGRSTEYPSTLDPVKISACIVAGSATTVRLHLALGQQAYQIIPMMASGGACYETTIPPQPAGTLVKYYVEAVDVNGFTLQYPRLNPEIFVVDNDPVAPGDFVVNEIMADPIGDDVYNAATNPNPPSAWIEYYNNRATPIDVSYFLVGNALTGVNCRTLPAGTVVPGYGYLILAGNKTRFLNMYPEVDPDIVIDAQWMDGTVLPNAGYESSGEPFPMPVIHANSLGWDNGTGNQIDVVRYGGSAPWPDFVIDTADGFSYSLVRPDLDNSLGQNWLKSLLNGTPGAANTYSDPYAAELVKFENSPELAGETGSYEGVITDAAAPGSCRCMWLEWTASETGSIYFDLLGGTGFTGGGIWGYSGGGGGMSGLTGVGSAAGSGGSHQITFPVVAGENYRIKIEAYGDLICHFVLDWSMADTVPPTITCPVPVTLPATSGTNSAAVVFSAHATDDRPGVALSYSHASGSLFEVGETTVTATATDLAGNSVSCSFVVKILDSQPPAIVCPEDKAAFVEAGECGAVVPVELPSVSDNDAVSSNSVSGSRSDGLALGERFPTGETIITWRAEDQSGNHAECIQRITVVDNLAPVFSSNFSDVTVEAQPGLCGAIVELPAPQAMDGCGPVTISGVRSDGKLLDSLFSVGTTSVTWTASDEAGNTATRTQQVSVSDNQPPLLTAPASRTVSAADELCSTTLGDGLPGMATATDNCEVFSVEGVRDDNMSLEAPYPLGSTTITWVAMDVNGNVETADQIITVTDEEGPSIVAPKSICVDNSPGLCEATVETGTPVATDNCTTTRPAEGTRSDGRNLDDAFPVGITQIIWRAADDAGNVSETSQTIHVRDSEAPELTAPADVVVDADPGSCSASSVNLGTPAASDNCGVLQVSSNAAASFAVGKTAVTWTAEDVHGNRTEKQQLVTVRDSQIPTLACPADLIVDNTAGKAFADTDHVNLDVPTAADNCGILSVVHNAPRQLPVGNNAVTWTATDIHGNKVNCVQQVVVKDVEAPILSVPDDITTHTDAGAPHSTGNPGTATAIDNVCVESLLSDAPGVFPVGTTLVTWTATDAAGNMTTASQSVTVIDSERPSVIAPADVTVANAQGLCGAIEVQIGSATATDNCGIAELTNDAPTDYPVGSTLVAWKATDLSGNTSVSLQRVTIVDTERPLTLAPSAVYKTTDPGQSTAVVADLGQATGQDNCGVLSVQNDAPGALPVGKTVVTWTVTDAHGNMSSATQEVSVADVEKPTISAPADVTVGTDAGAPTASHVDLGEAIATDNCGIREVTNDAPLTFDLGETLVIWTAVDVNDNVSTTAQRVIVEDREEPEIVCQGTVMLPCSPDQLAHYNPQVQASDNAGTISLAYDPPLENGFPAGDTTLKVTATDAAGNSSSCSFVVSRAAIGFVGFLPPVGGSVEAGDGGSWNDPIRVFKLGSTIPLKIQLGCETPVVSGVHTVSCRKFTSEVSAEDPIEVNATDGATYGNQFRLAEAASGMWKFNLDTKNGFSRGTWLVTATLSDGNTHSVWIGLK